MSSKNIQLSKYAQRQYGFTTNEPIDFDVAVSCGCALIAIAGADGELSEKELQWYIDEQEMLAVDSEELKEYIKTLRKFDFKNANLQELLVGIKYNFPINFYHTMLYQAIKMSRADGVYHAKEKAYVAKAAEILGIEPTVVIALETVAEMEETTARLRLALFETQRN
jgi:uncharacterized tellurite resistance protein B-like protein